MLRPAEQETSILRHRLRNTQGSKAFDEQMLYGAVSLLWHNINQSHSNRDGDDPIIFYIMPNDLAVARITLWGGRKAYNLRVEASQYLGTIGPLVDFDVAPDHHTLSGVRIPESGLNPDQILEIIQSIKLGLVIKPETYDAHMAQLGK